MVRGHAFPTDLKEGSGLKWSYFLSFSSNLPYVPWLCPNCPDYWWGSRCFSLAVGKKMLILSPVTCVRVKLNLISSRPHHYWSVQMKLQKMMDFTGFHPSVDSPEETWLDRIVVTLNASNNVSSQSVPLAAVSCSVCALVLNQGRILGWFGFWFSTVTLKIIRRDFILILKLCLDIYKPL